MVTVIGRHWNPPHRPPHHAPHHAPHCDPHPWADGLAYLQGTVVAILVVMGNVCHQVQ